MHHRYAYKSRKIMAFIAVFLNCLLMSINACFINYDLTVNSCLTND